MDTNKFKTMDPLSAAISAGSSFLGSVVNGLFTKHQNKENRKQTNYWNERQLEFNSEEAFKQRSFEADQARRTREFNASEAEKQRLFNETMWQKENAYNTPSAQLARLRDAGFNPNLFGGDNTAGSVASATPASASAPQGASASAGSLSSYQGVPIQVNNPLMDASIIRLNNAQADKLEADADDVRGMAPEKVKESQKRQAQIDADIQLINKNVAKAQSEIDVNEELKFIYDKEGKIKEKDLERYEERYLAELNQIKAETGWKLANMWSCWSEMVKNIDESKMFKAQAGYYGQLANKVKEEARELKSNNDVLELYNGIRMDWINENGDIIKTTLTKTENAKQSQADSDKSTANVIDLHNGWMLNVDGDTGEYTPVAIGLQVLDFLTMQAGRVFGANASYSNGSYSSISDTHSTVNSTSNATVKSTSHNTNYNYNHGNGTPKRKNLGKKR